MCVSTFFSVSSAFFGEKMKLVCHIYEWHEVEISNTRELPVYFMCFYFSHGATLLPRGNSPSLSGAGGRREVSVLV